MEASKKTTAISRMCRDCEGCRTDDGEMRYGYQRGGSEVAKRRNVHSQGECGCAISQGEGAEAWMAAGRAGFAHIRTQSWRDDEHKSRRRLRESRRLLERY
jgi:hypothetical protein